MPHLRSREVVAEVEAVVVVGVAARVVVALAGEGTTMAAMEEGITHIKLPDGSVASAPYFLLTLEWSLRRELGVRTMRKSHSSYSHV